jgi:5-methylthioadenosine/S-adenosylhomocysteine deaminase
VDPWTVLELATWRSAEVTGLAGEVGRLEPGLRGDLVVLEPGWAGEPAADAATMVVYGCGVECVRDVIVDGIPVVLDRALTTDSAATIRREARAAASALGARLGWT